MREIRTSGSMSGTWKRSASRHRATSRLYPQQVSQALGSDRITQLAQQAGLSPGQASAGLATMLPHLIDKLTPGGKLPDSGMMQQGLGWLESHLTSHQ
jgi:uncharacterized protein YidB (DUF937 family)